jgi:hypothetical protein
MYLLNIVHNAFIKKQLKILKNLVRDALVFEFLPSARIENLCRVHLAKICAGCT